MSLWNKFWSLLRPSAEPRLPEYGSLYFNHLIGLYDTLDVAKIEVPDKQRLDATKENYKKGETTWKDIYSFELTLLKYLDIERLRSRLISARSYFQNVAGPKQYEAYLALKPPDPLTTTDDKALRRDLEYLCNEFCIRYAMTAAREQLRTRLLKIAVFLLLLFLVIGAILIKVAPWSISTLSVVIFAGVIGAFISVQQRIQSSYSEGDPIYNLALLTHGVFGVFLSPVSGAVFALLLYLMFTAGILKGAAFPDLTLSPEQPVVKVDGGSTQTPDPTKTSAARGAAQSSKETESGSKATEGTSKQGLNQTSGGTESQNSNQVNPPEKDASQTQAGADDSKTGKKESPTPGQEPPAPLPSPMTLAKFLNVTGPASVSDFALLTIWAFIAGFAERLVPDALNRMIARSEATNPPKS
jgi:hypothetical protein